MHIALAWFVHAPPSTVDVAAARRRFDAAVAVVVPPSYHRHTLGGDDWGVVVLHRPDPGAYRWPVVAAGDPVTTVPLGLPVGADLTGGATGIGGRLLGGEDVHRDVVPPFGLLALDAGGRFAVQQDWLGMCRLFAARADGITVLATRPGLLAAFLHGRPRADPEAWAGYAVSGMFGGDSSPVEGTRLLRPGERITGRRRPGGGWAVTTEIRYAADDVVASGFAGQGRPPAEAMDRAADALRGVATSFADLYDDEIVLGLSGGKDSRLIAASLVAAGRLPRFSTNNDTAAEGETARRLTGLLRDRRGLDVEHRVVPAGAPGDVLRVGLRERGVRLQRMYDFQFPATYLVRPAVRERLRDDTTPATLTGAAGELATGAWYPKAADCTPEEQLLAKMLGGLPAAAVSGDALDAGRDRIRALIARARGLGLHDEHVIDYVFLTDRLRRWCTSAYALGMVTPFLSPGFVAASFALTPQQKRERWLHTELTARLVPEWSGVPYVTVSTGPSAATRIFDGDGIAVMAGLLDTAHGPLTGLMDRPAVERELTSALHRGRACPRTLRQFTWLALASERLEPDHRQPATGAALTRISAPPPAASIAAPATGKPAVSSLRAALRRPHRAVRRLILPPRRPDR